MNQEWREHLRKIGKKGIESQHAGKTKEEIALIMSIRGKKGMASRWSKIAKVKVE